MMGNNTRTTTALVIHFMVVNKNLKYLPEPLGDQRNKVEQDGKLTIVLKSMTHPRWLLSQKSLYIVHQCYKTIKKKMVGWYFSIGTNIMLLYRHIPAEVRAGAHIITRKHRLIHKHTVLYIHIFTSTAIKTFQNERSRCLTDTRRANTFCSTASAVLCCPNK